MASLRSPPLLLAGLRHRDEPERVGQLAQGYSLRPRLPLAPEVEGQVPAVAPPSDAPLQAGVARAVAASRRGTTTSGDDQELVRFRSFYESWFGLALESTFLRAPATPAWVGHRTQAVAGYLTKLRGAVGARSRKANTVRLALIRAFSGRGWDVGVFATPIVCDTVRGLEALHPPVRMPTILGVSEEMLKLTLRVAQLTTPRFRDLSMAALGALLAYGLGSRVSELSATASLMTSDVDEAGVLVLAVHRNRHTLLVSDISAVLASGAVRCLGDGLGDHGGVQRLGSATGLHIVQRSSKTITRPVTTSFVVTPGAAAHSEAGLINLLIERVIAWVVAGGHRASDPLLSYRLSGSEHHLRDLRASGFRAYTKWAANEVGFPSAHFSSKSWKVGSVSHGLMIGESASSVATRGQHASFSSTKFYDVGHRAGAEPPSFGVPDRLVRLDIEREARERGAVAAAPRSEGLVGAPSFAFP